MKWSLWTLQHTFFGLTDGCHKIKPYLLEWVWIDTKSFPLQNENSFKEQKYAIKVCTDAIDNYNEPLKNHMVKLFTIGGFTGCGKS